MKNLFTAFVATFTEKMAEQEAITKKGFRHITDNVKLVNANVGVVDTKVDAILAKAEAILAKLETTGVSPVQEPQVRNENENRTSRQYNAVANQLLPIKNTSKGEAVFGICEDCGLELTSNLVVGYCKANGLPTYCPKCQKKHGVDSASRGIGKSAQRVPAKLPATQINKGHSTPKVGSEVQNEFLQVRVCGCCGEHVKYSTAAAFNESVRKAKALGLPQYVHGKCAKAILDAREVEATKVEMPVVETPVADGPVMQAPVGKVVVTHIETVAKAFELLVSDDMTTTQLADLKIGVLRKYADAKGFHIAFDGNVWNRTKATYIEVVQEVAEPVVNVTEEAEYVPAEVPALMVADAVQEWVPMTPNETVVNEDVAGQFSLLGKDGTRLF